MNPSTISDKKVAIPYTPIAEDDLPPPAYTNKANTTLLDTTGLVATPQMTIGGARNSKSLPIGLDGKRSFNHGLCSCLETPSLALNAICCPCIQFSRTHSKMVHLSTTGEPHPAPQNVGLWCCLYALAPQATFGVGQIMLQCFSRLQTRQRYGIRGDMVQDALVASFCTPCSLVQEAREIADEEEALREGGAPPETFYRDEEVQVQGAETPAAVEVV
ncbi:hypothetical protein RQP46_008278 [Phenoliferia psychrophenolica]